MRQPLPTLLQLALAAAISLSSTLTHAIVERQQPIRLQLNQDHRFQFAGYYAAIEQGFYREAGFEVELREPGPGEDPVAAVHAGNADFGVAAADLVIARNRGWDVVALAVIYQHSPRVLLARRDAGIETLHDLIGKRVMIERQAASLLGYLRAERVPIGRLDLVEHSFTPADLIEGQVAAMSARVTDELFILDRAGVDSMQFNPRTAGIDFYGDTLFTTGREIADRPQRVRAFVTASLRGWRYALEHPAEIVELILAKYSQRRTREQLLFEAERSAALIAADRVELGYMNPGRWDYIAGLYQSLGLMPNGLDIDSFLWHPRSETEGIRIAAPIATGGLLLAVALLVSWRFHRLGRMAQRAISEREQVKQDLQRSEARHRLLVQNAPFPVVISRVSDGLLRFFNPVAAQMLGIEPGAKRELHATLFYVRPYERERLLALIETQDSVNRFETLLRSLDGRELWVDMSATRLDYEGDACLFVAFSDITERKAVEKSLRRIADTDALTGVASRRRFLQMVERELAVSLRYGRTSCIISIDLDRFKQINDTYGHPVGDRALAHFARTVESVLRSPDLLGRIGGEEFAVLLRETPLAEAVEAAERLRAAVEQADFNVAESNICLTVSIGVSEVQAEDSVASLMERVDGLLYQAKDAGGNRVYSG